MEKRHENNRASICDGAANEGFTGHDWRYKVIPQYCDASSPMRWIMFFFFSSRRRHTRFDCDWSSDVCSSDLCPALRIKGAKEPKLVLDDRTTDIAAEIHFREAIGSRTREREILHVADQALGCRSEERRVGKECRSRWSPDH